MVQHIPPGVKQPTDTDEVIGSKSSICNACDDCCKGEFPFPESATEVCRACTSDHDCVEVSSVWLSEERARGNIQNGDRHRPHQIHDLDIGSRMELHSFPFPTLVLGRFAICSWCWTFAAPLVPSGKEAEEIEQKGAAEVLSQFCCQWSSSSISVRPLRR